ncbi:MAG: crossover junction endodeoxyribonuclease RuvC [Verrucomicrobiales bacterium]|nr:crossover junction endodeoxyribonuclease RuvC [Verrucomicrobiales bacterium]
MSALVPMGISPEAFRKLQARVQSPKRRPEPLNGLPPQPASLRREVVLGIDPSLRGTGWGVIQRQRGTVTALGFGTVHCAASLPRSRCLVRIADELRTAIRAHQPTVCAIEGLFFAQNLQTALIMGEARGVCLLAAAEAGLEITEIAPRKVKQAIVGFGGAQKSAVGRMVQRLLGLAEPPQADAADALAIALAHAQDRSRPGLECRRPL